MGLYGGEVPLGTVSNDMSLKHTHTHRHKSEPWQSFADISPPATTHTYSAAAYMQGQRNMEKDRTV